MLSDVILILLLFSLKYRHRVLSVIIVFLFYFYVGFIVLLMAVDPLMRHYFIHLVVCGTICKFLKVFSSSLARPSSQKCGWAGSEHYVRTHITEPLCYILQCFCLKNPRIRVTLINIYLLLGALVHNVHKTPNCFNQTVVVLIRNSQDSIFSKILSLKH